MTKDDGSKDPIRQQIGRLGAYTRWAQTENRTAATQAMRDGMQRKFEDEVDPDRVLPLQERAKRVELARKAYYQRLALKSAQARRARKKGGATAKTVQRDGTN